MPDNNKRKALYDQLTQDGYDLGDYDSFSKNLDNESNRKNLYDAITADNYDVGDYDSFSKKLYENTEGSISNQVIAEYDQSVADNTSGKKLQHGTVSSAFGGYEAGESGTALYANRQYEQAQERKAEAEKSEREQQASEIRGNLEASGQLGRLDEAEKRAQSVIDKKGGDFSLAKGVFGGVFAIPSVVRYIKNRFFDDESRAAYATREKVKEAKALIKEAGHAGKGWADKQIGGLARGLVKGATDEGTWDFGVTGIADAYTLNDIVSRQQKGEKITRTEQDLLDVSGLATAVEEAYNDQVGMGYNVGRSLPESAGFMAQMYLNPASGLAKAAVKKYGTTTVKKVLARAAGDVAEMGIGTLTTGAGRVIEDAYNRLNGQSTYDIDNNGIIRYGGQEEQETLSKAVFKALGSNFIENYSEALGEYFSPIGSFLGNVAEKGIRKGGLGKLVDIFGWMKSSQWSKALQDFKEKTKFNGFVGEYAEEVAGNIMNAATVGDMNFNSPDDPRSVFNLETNIETALSCMFMSGTMMAVESIGNDPYGYISSKRMVDAERDAEKAFAGGVDNPAMNWDNLRNGMDKATPEGLKQMLSSIAQDADLTPEQKKAAIYYGMRLTQWQAYNGRRIANKEEMTEEARIADDAYDEGTSMPPEQHYSAEQEKTMARETLRNADVSLFDNVERILADNGGSGEIQNLTEGLPDEQGSLVWDYYNKAKRVEGIMDAGLEEAMDAGERAENVLQDAIVEDENGSRTITTAIYKDEPVYVVANDGKHATILRDGKKDMVGSDRLSDIEQSDADAVIEGIKDNFIRDKQEALNNSLNHHPKTQMPQVGMQLWNGDVPFIVTDVSADGVVQAFPAVLDNDSGQMVPKNSSTPVEMTIEESKLLQDDYYNKMAAAEKPEKAAITDESVDKTSEKESENESSLEGEESKVSEIEYPSSMIGRSLTEDEAGKLVLQMELNAEISPDLELTPENWVSEFGDNGIISTPLGDVKMGNNQFLKLSQQGRNGKLGMIKPTLTNPDVVIEDESKAKDGKEERGSSYVFVKAFTDKGGKRLYYFTSVTVKKGGNEVVVSNQEKGVKRISKLLQNGKIAWINNNDSLHPTAQEEKPVSLGETNGPTDDGNQPALLGINSPAVSESKDSKPSSEKQEGNVNNLIPVDEKGNLLYHKVPVEVTVADLTDGTLNDSEIDGFVSANQAESDKLLDKVKKSAPKIGTNKAKYLSDKQVWQAKVDDAQQQSDYWKEVASFIRQQREMPGDKIAEEILSIGEPLDGLELAAQELAKGRLPLLYEDYKRELSFGDKEAGKMFGLFKSRENGGLTIEEAGEQLMQDDLENGTNFFDQEDANAGRNAIIGVLASARTRGDLIEFIHKNRKVMAERERSAEEEHDEIQREAWAQEHFGMSYADYVVYEEMIGEIIKEKAIPEEVVQEFYDNFAEELNNKDNGRTKENVASDGRGTDSSGSKISERILPEEQSGDNRGTETDTSAEVNERADNKGIPAPKENVSASIEDARKEVDTNPTDAQKEAGNYKKGHIKLDGYDISIENPKGSERSGTDANGNKWAVTMNNDYGYIRGTEGVDGDHIDVFLSDNPAEGNVYVVDQLDTTTGKFDEHKVMYGFTSMDEATNAYLSNYSPGWQGLGAISEVSKEEFKKWIDSSHRKTKPFAEYKGVKTENDVRTDRQGNPVDADGKLIIEDVSSVNDITDADFINPTRSIGLPAIPRNVSDAIGADGKRVIIKKNIFEKNRRAHSDITPVQSREILLSALYAPDLYGQNQKAKRPYNWIVINTKDEAGHNRIVLLEVNDNKDNVEIVHWHYTDERGVEKIRRQAKREDGQLLILPSVDSEEVGALSDPTLDLPSADKDSEQSGKKQEVKENTSSLDAAREELADIKWSDRNHPANEDIFQMAERVVNENKEKEFVSFSDFMQQRMQEKLSIEYDSLQTWKEESPETYSEEYDNLLSEYGEYLKDLSKKGSLQTIYDHSSVKQQKKIRDAFSDADLDYAEYLNTKIGRKRNPKSTKKDVTIKKGDRAIGRFFDGTVVSGIVEEVNQDGIQIRSERNGRIYNILPDKILNEEGNDILFRIVHHGTGTSFEKFSTEKIGTGEGNQSFGWGLYFTDKKDIAQYYAETIGDMPSYVLYKNGEPADMTDEISRVIYNHDGDVKKAIRKIRRDADMWKKEGDEEFAAEIMKTVDRLKLEDPKAWEMKEEGNRHIYDVEIPDTGFLHWDNPLTDEQKKQIIEQADKENLKISFYGDLLPAKEFFEKIGSEAEGAQIYKALERTLGSDKEASLFLNRAGFNGIEYVAGRHSGKKSVDSNFVVFDENAVRVIKHLQYRDEERAINDGKVSIEDAISLVQRFQATVPGSPEISIITNEEDIDNLPIGDITKGELKRALNNPKVTGCYSNRAKMVFVFPSHASSVSDFEDTLSHETAHYSSRNAELPDDLKESVLEYVEEKYPDVYSNVAEYPEKDRAEEAIAYLFEKKCREFGLDSVLSSKFAGDRDVATVFTEITKFLNNEKGRERNQLRGEEGKRKQPDGRKSSGYSEQAVHNGREVRRDDLFRESDTEGRGRTGAGERGTEEAGNAEVDNVRETPERTDADGRRSVEPPVFDPVTDNIIEFAERMAAFNRNNNLSDKSDEDAIRYRMSENVESTSPLSSSAVEAWDKLASSKAFLLRETAVDYLTAVEKFQDLIAKRTGSKVLDYENAYQAFLALSSRSKDEMDRFEAAFVKPLNNAIIKITGEKKAFKKWNWKEGALRDLVMYVEAKHGMERNRQMAIEKFIKDSDLTEGKRKEMYAEWQNSKKGILDDSSLTWTEKQARLDKTAALLGAKLSKDYSGLSSVFGDKGKYPKGWRKAAEDYVNSYESSHKKEDMDGLWNSIRAATGYAMNKQLESGLVDKEYVERQLERFEYYVPLRGFANEIAEDVYGYANDRTRRGGSPVKTAGGRSSEAENPFGGILQVCYSSISAGNKNLAKQKLFYFVNNHDTEGLAVVNRAWRIKLDELGKHKDLLVQYQPEAGEELPEWVEAVPNIPDNPKDGEVSEIMRRFEELMEKLKEEKTAEEAYKKSKTSYRTLHNQRSEHEIPLMIGGNRSVITITGNPRLAQAVNGLLNPSIEDGIIAEYAKRVQSFMAGAFTSVNIAFAFANLSKDTMYANNQAFIKENGKYWINFTKNQKLGFVEFPYMVKLLNDYRKGKMDEKDETGRMFKEFMENGGATGYTFVGTQKEYTDKLEKELKKLAFNRSKASPKNILKAFFDSVEFGGQAAELVNRFAAYRTSREMGRSISRSVSDAKEITVNFNRKGAGIKTAKVGNGKTPLTVGVAAALSQYGRYSMLFFNANMQAKYRLYKNLREHPIKTTATLIGNSMLFGGVVVPFINYMIMPLLFGEGGDDDDYYNGLTDYERTHNICLRLKNGYWLKIPLSPEMAPWYSIGDMIGGAVMGKREMEASDFMKSLMDAFTPVGINWELEGGKFLLNFVPTVSQPIAQHVTNVNFMGVPLRKEDPWGVGKYDPEYRKVFNGTSPTLVELSKLSNQIAGGDKVKASGWMNWNPRVLQNYISGYTGGWGTTILAAADVVTGMMQGDKAKDDVFSITQTPVLSRFVISGDKDVKLRRLNAKYKDVGDFIDEFNHDDKGYKKMMEDASDKGDMLEYAEYKTKLEKMYDEKARMYHELSEINKAVKDYNKYLKKNPDDELSRDMLYELMLRGIKRMEEKE